MKMKKYVGIKEVKAQPMTANQAVEKGYKVGSHSNEDGYEVEYADGYRSWSPKDVFKEAYQLAETPLDRMLIECRDLTTKVEKLHTFTNSDKFNKLDDATRVMLLAQKRVMQDYQNLLNIRYTKMENNDGGLSFVSFGVAITLLSEGFAIRRIGWNDKGLFVIKQVPAHIESDVIPKMQSLPQSAKDLILKGKGFIDYTSQCLIYNENTGRADSWVPSISDVFAEDWEIAL